MASVIAPAYIAETSPPRVRGRLGSLQQLAIVSGIFLSLAVDWLLAHLAGGSGKELWLRMEAWRWMFLMMSVPAVVYGALAFTIPESPWYLVATHRIPEARKVLTMLLGERNLEITINRIQETLQREDKPSWRDLTKPGGGPFRLYGIVWVGLGYRSFQQFVGINVIFYYSNVLWEAVGFDESCSFTITVITSIANIATTLIAIALIDKIGRRPLLLIGFAGMAVTLATMAVIFGTAPQVDGQPQLTGASGPVALIAANLFVVAFGMSWVVWVLLGEMFPNPTQPNPTQPNPTRSGPRRWVWRPPPNGPPTGSSPSRPRCATSWAPPTAFYAMCAFLSFLFVWKWVRETKGVSLEDMHAELLHDDKSATH